MLYRSLYVGPSPFPGLAEAKFSRAVADLFDLLKPVLPAEETGGVLIVRLDDRQHVSLIGRFDKYPLNGSYRIAVEKLRRTVQMHRRHGHRTAWLSRNPGRKKYAGCICIADNCFASFSGLSEHWDEALLAIAAWLCGLYGLEDVEHIRSVSQNPCIPVAMELVRQQFLEA